MSLISCGVISSFLFILPGKYFYIVGTINLHNVAIIKCSILIYCIKKYLIKKQILGKPGTGKSTVLKQIAEQLQNYPNFVFIKQVNCKTIKGKTMDSLAKFFSTVFSELLLHKPSVLILDDLHILCENVQGDEVAPNYIYFSRFA